MKDTVISIRLEPALRQRLDRLCKRWGRSRSEVVREALSRQFALLQFQQARHQVMPFAEARGYLTDEDVFRDVS